MKDDAFDISNGTSGRGPAPAVARAAHILSALGDEPGGLGISQLARAVGLNKSTVHGIVTALASEELVVPIGGGRAYALGPRLAELGARVQDRQVLEAGVAALSALTEGTGRTALLGRRTGDGITVLARQEGRALGISAPVGFVLPLMAGAVGKAYLAELPPADAHKIVQRLGLAKYTERSIVDIDRYLDAVRRAAGRGYATDEGEYLRGVSAAARAFAWLGAHYVVWSLSIEGDGPDDETGPAVRRAVDDIVSALEGAQGGRNERAVCAAGERRGPAGCV